MNKTIHDAIFSRDYWAEVDHYFDDGEMFLICGDCSTGISYGDLYCSHCGKYLSYKKVNPIFLKLWDDRLPWDTDEDEKDEAMSAFIEKKSKRTQLLLQPSVHEAIRRLAEEEETSFNDYVNTLLKEHASKVLGEINS